MTRETVLEAVQRAFADVAPELDVRSIDPNAELIEGIDLDSMDFLNIVTALDQLLGVEVPERDYPRLHSLQGMVDYLTKRCNEAR